MAASHFPAPRLHAPVGRTRPTTLVSRGKKIPHRRRAQETQPDPPSGTAKVNDSKL